MKIRLMLCASVRNQLPNWSDATPESFNASVMNVPNGILIKT